MSKGLHPRPRRRGDAAIQVTPIATPQGARLGIDVANSGRRALHAPVVDVRPAPPGIRAEHLGAVVAARVDGQGRIEGRLAAGESRELELACPLRPGPLYGRVLALDPDDDEPVYGLPIETLLWIEVRWHERGVLGWRRARRRLVRGRYADTAGP